MLSKTRELATDSKKKSMIECVMDIMIGFIMYLPINFLVLPLFAEQISSYDILGFFQLSAIFTSIALVRKYTIRRWFENLKNIIYRMVMAYIFFDTSGSIPSENKSNSFGGSSSLNSDDGDYILHYFHVIVTNKFKILEQFKQIGNC